MSSIDNIISIVGRGPLLLFDFGTIALDGKFLCLKARGVPATWLTSS